MILIQIKDYDNYFINNYGTVYNKHLKELRKEKTKGGYLRVTLYKNGKQKHFLIHRLVAQAFIPNPKNLPEVNHIDNNPVNNRVENLAWCTAKENSRWSKSKAVIQLNPKTNEFIRIWKCIIDASEYLNIDNGSISKCCKGKLKTAGGYKWKYIKEIECSTTNWRDKVEYEI